MFRITKNLTIATSAFLLSACNFQAGTDAEGAFSLSMDSDTTVVVSASTPDFKTSDVLTITSDSAGRGGLNEGDLATTDPSDISISGGEKGVYRLNRGLNSITLYNVSGDGSLSPDWEYGVEDADENGNPYDLVEADNDKGYVIRYNSESVMEVSLGAETESAFGTGNEIDLSSFAADGSIPRMNSGVYDNGKLFVLLERLSSGYAAEYDSYLVGYNTSDLSAIDLSPTDNTTTALDLDLRNAGSLAIYDDTLYVAAAGDTLFQTAGQYQGGIKTVDLSDYSDELILDDGSTDYTWGRVTDFAIVDESRGYFIGSKSTVNDDYSVNHKDRLYYFDPGAANPSATVTAVTEGDASFGGLQVVRNSESGNPSTLLFMGRSAENDKSAAVLVVEVSTNPDEVSLTIETKFNPSAFAVVD